MKYLENITAVSNLKPDFMGFIFYEKSPRYFQREKIVMHDKNIQKTGVFVNETFQVITKKVKQHRLNFVQLHGDEKAGDCDRLQQMGIPVIKAFSIHDQFQWEYLKEYDNKCTYFLFDTFGKQRGGNGEAFDWKLLDKYQGNTAFFLSGGIGINNIDSVFDFDHSFFTGIDINSKVEETPGKKKVELVQKMIKKVKIHNEKHSQEGA